MTARTQLEGYLGAFRKRLKTLIVARGAAVLCVAALVVTLVAVLIGTRQAFPTQLMILHEMAHAWADRALTDERKASFQELRGWEHWRAHDEVAWHENGTEQAAEIMVWGLVDRPIPMLRIHQASCEELEAGYRTLTGAAPLHGFRDHC